MSMPMSSTPLAAGAPEIADAAQAGSPPHARDAALARRIAAGDGEAVEEVYARFRSRIQAFALRRLGDAFEAEDVTQDVFLHVHRGAGRYQGRSSLATWMFGIAHHEICNRLRRRRAGEVSLDSVEAGALTDPGPSPERRVEAARLLERCCDALAERVSEPQQHIFRLRYEEHRSVRAIASRVGKSRHAVKIGLFRARRTIAESSPGLDQFLG
jgi:RNA polymerase sigma-70 factor, ECF subfamily